MKKVALFIFGVVVAMLCGVRPSFSQNTSQDALNFDRRPEFFESIVESTSKDAVFTLYQLSYPFSGSYYFTQLSANGDAASARVTPFATQVSRRATLDVAAVARVRRILSDGRASLIDNLSTAKPGDPYSVLVITEGKNSERINMIGEIPGSVIQTLELIDEHYTKAEKAYLEKNEESSRKLLKKYGVWQEKPGLVRIFGGGQISLKGEGKTLIYKTGLLQPFTETKKTEVPIYYAIVRYPPDGRIVGGVSGGSSDDPITPGGITWSTLGKQSGERQLLISYNAIDFSISITNAAYKLSSGNVFMIVMNESWNPVVTQLPIRINTKPNDPAFIEILRRELHDQSLEFQK